MARISFPIVPTERAAWLAAALAPLAVLVGAMAPQAWLIALFAAAALVVLIVADALLAGKLGDWDIAAPADAEVGEPASLAMQCTLSSRSSATIDGAFEYDPRLGEGGRGVLSLSPNKYEEGFSGNHIATPNRRGTAGITRAWLRWTGPLGLGARQVDRTLENEVRIWPDLSPVRSSELQTYLRDAQLGLITRRIRGEGTQFEALSEYEPGMDRRRID